MARRLAVSGSEEFSNASNAEQGGDPRDSPQRAEPLYAPDRYCLRCQEPLPWYDEGPIYCPHCRFACDPQDPRTYRTRRTRVGWKFWFPGFALAVTSGVLSYAACLPTGGLGLALFFAVPISFGAVLGYGTRTEAWLGITLAIVAVSMCLASLGGLLVGGAYGAGPVEAIVTGVAGGCALSSVLLAPTSVGIILGIGLRATLAKSRWDQRSFFPLALLVLFSCPPQTIDPAPAAYNKIRSQAHGVGDVCKSWTITRRFVPTAPAAQAATGALAIRAELGGAALSSICVR